MILSKKYLKSRKVHLLTFVFPFFLFALLYPLQISGNWVDDQLKQLTLEEKASLHYFFSKAIKKSHLGHILFFSNKPACLISEFIDAPRSLECKLFLKGWSVWKKKEHLFPHPNFIIYHEIVKFDDGNTVLHIYFINKKTLLDCLSHYEEILKINLGSDFSSELFIKNLEQKNIPSLFKEDESLVGFMLGFGMESSLAFKQRAQLKKVIFCIPNEKIHVFNIQEKMFCTLKNVVTPVSFIGNPESVEVQTLRQRYTEELEKIEAIYQQKNLLKLSLYALCGVGN